MAAKTTHQKVQCAGRRALAQRNNCVYGTLHRRPFVRADHASRAITASKAAQKLSWPGERVQCNSPAATYTSACETPSPRHKTADDARELQHLRRRGLARAGGRLARLPPGRAGRTSSPGSRRSRSSSGSLVYKTLECGGDVRAAIKAQLEGDEKHVRVAGVGYFIGIYLFKQVAPPAEIDWSCPSL